MNGISKFIDRVSLTEARGGRDLVLSMDDARLLRDEIAKLLLQLHASAPVQRESTSIEFVGGKW